MTRPRPDVPALLVLPVLLMLLASTGCGDRGWPRAGGIVVDTLPGGTVVVRSAEAAAWGVGEEWRLVEEVRIGAATGGGPDVFGDMVVVAADEAGRIYVADSEAGEVRVFDAEGVHLRTFGRPGDGPGEFRRISGMDWGPDGRLHIMDGQLARLSVFDPDGTFRAFHNRPAGFVMIPWRGRVDRDGRVYDAGMAQVRDERRPAVVRFDAAMSPLDTLVLPRHEARTFDLADAAGSRRITTAIPFSPTQVWHVAPDGTIWVGVTDEYRLLQLGFDGDTLRIFERRARARRVAAEARDSAMATLAWFTELGGSIDPSLVPDTRPHFASLFVDHRDYLWVGIDAVDGDGSGPGFDVFDPDGRYLGRVEADPGLVALPAPVVRGSNVYAVTTDDLGVSYVIRYRIGS